MNYILDTNVCIAYLRGTHASVVDRVQQSDRASLHVTSVSAAELHCGALRSARSTENSQAVRGLLALFRTLDFDSQAAERHAAIRFGLEQNGTAIGPNDTLIAASLLTI